MKSRALFKQQIIINMFILIILSASTLLSIRNDRKENQEYYYNKARLLAADSCNALNNGVYEKGKYPYSIFDLEGKAVYVSSGMSYKLGEVYNLSEILSFDHTFQESNRKFFKASFILSKAGRVDRFAIFLLPQKLVIKHTGATRYLYIFLPCIIGIIVVFIILILRNIYLKKHIINPIVEISRSAKAIMQGNYDLQVVKSEGKRLLYSEVDELMFGFELMRDEIKDKAIREEQLKRSQKELISCISHDLKTPISTITAYSEGMRDGLADNPEKQKKYAEIIAAKAEVLTKMINDLLEHSNAELNELKIKKKEIYFADYFLRAMKEIKLYTEQKGVILEYNPNVPNLLINMDEGRINQVIYNLIENSLKYMDKAEGKIFISCEYSSPNKKLSISVKDNGSGINMADIPYVFDKFYRAEKSRNLSIPGSGLGLSICKFIVEKHGGSITCQSRQSEGTVFTFTLEAEK